MAGQPPPPNVPPPEIAGLIKGLLTIGTTPPTDDVGHSRDFEWPTLGQRVQAFRGVGGMAMALSTRRWQSKEANLGEWTIHLESLDFLLILLDIVGICWHYLKVQACRFFQHRQKGTKMPNMFWNRKSRLIESLVHPASWIGDYRTPDPKFSDWIKKH